MSQIEHATEQGGAAEPKSTGTTPEAGQVASKASNSHASGILGTGAPPTVQPSFPAAATAAGPPLSGGAAVLARLRAERAKSKAAADKVKTEPVKEVTVVYASQTGTAQEIAKGIQAESNSHGIKSRVVSMNELGFDAVASGKAPILVIVASSTGDGDAPDNSAKFYAALKRRTQEKGILAGVHFTCLGLGDSNYTRFMAMSRAIRSRMTELGATPFYNMAEADEVDGLECKVDPWVAGIWEPLKQLVKGNTEEIAKPGKACEEQAAANGEADEELVGVPALADCRVTLRWLPDATEFSAASSEQAMDNGGSDHEAEGLYSPAAPFHARITHAEYLTASSSDRKVLHLVFDLEGSGISYQPGNSIGVSPLNADDLVDGLLTRLGEDGSRRFEVLPADESYSGNGPLPHLGCPCTLRQALQSSCDLTSVPRKSLLRLLAEHCSDASERKQLLHLSSRGGRDAYAALIAPVSPSVLDLLHRFPSCRPPLAALLDALLPLAPRLYSLSSSPLEYPDSAHVAFSVVRIGDPPRNVPELPAKATGSRQNGISSTSQHNNAVQGVSGRWGVATGWLERCVAPLLAGTGSADVRVGIFLRRGGAFRHPNTLAAPMVMIGPGTGVTPFRGFLQHRRQLLKQHGGAAGPAWLYFGCRSANEDFLYRDDLQAFVEDGTLDRLETAFSRAGPDKLYVQHRMLEQAEELGQLFMHPEAHIFVCGDGAKMAKDVHATLGAVLERRGMSPEEATAHLATMTRAGRYVRDIWS